MASELRIRMDAVLASLLDTLAERHGRTPEEEAAQLLAQQLQRAAQRLRYADSGHGSHV